MKVITAYSSKGGTTKTTTIANLGGYLADSGYNVLIVDADNTQPSLSSHYPLTTVAKYGLVRLIKSREIVDDMISKSNIEKLSVIYSDDNQNELPAFINDATDSRFRIRRAIKELIQRDESKFDFILIDTRGAKGILLDSAIIAADIILSPIPTDKISASEFMRGTVERYRETVDAVQSMNITLGPIFAFLSRYERTQDSNFIFNGIRDLVQSHSDIHLLDTIIPSATAYKAATTAQVPVHQFDTKKYKSIKNGAESIASLWGELTTRYNALNPDSTIKALGGASCKARR